MSDYTKPKSSLDQEPVQAPKPIELSGPVKVKKKSAFAMFFDNFFSGDMRAIRDYAIKDVLLPAAKRTLSNLISNSVEMLLFGETRGPRNNDLYSSSRPNKYTSYGAYYDAPKVSAKSSVRTEYEDYRTFVYPTAKDADDVLNYLRAEIQIYDRCKVSKIYEATSKQWDPAWENYVWYDLDSASVRYSADDDGYIMTLPRPTAIR